MKNRFLSHNINFDKFFNIFVYRLGRLTTIIGSSVIGGVLGIAQAYTHSFVIYAILECFVAMANAGILTSSFIYGAEWVTSKHRVATVTINGVANALGNTLVGLAAMYFEQDFRTFKLVMAAPSIICVLYYFILLESNNNRFHFIDLNFI